MKYGQIIQQAWQIIRRTKLLWILGGINFLLPFIKVGSPNTLGLDCLTLVFSSITLFIAFFSPYAIVSSTEKVLQGVTPKFREILTGFKCVIGRQILLVLAELIPIGLIFSFSAILLGMTFSILNLNITDVRSQVYMAIWLISPFAGFINFSFYGLVINKMGVLESLQHGIGVFGMNWINCLILDLFLEVPMLLTYLIIWLILYKTNNPSLSKVFFQTLATFPVNLWITAISTFIYLLSTVSFLLAYHQFIQKFDNPTLRAILSKP